MPYWVGHSFHPSASKGVRANNSRCSNASTKLLKLLLPTLVIQLSRESFVRLLKNISLTTLFSGKTWKIFNADRCAIASFIGCFITEMSSRCQYIDCDESVLSIVIEVTSFRSRITVVIAYFSSSVINLATFKRPS